MGILEAGFTSHIERTELGIACDRELIIHGHVALEVRSIFHVQRASIHAIAYQLAFRLHVAKVIDSHMAFDRSFGCGVIAGDPAGTFIGRSDGILIDLNVICIVLDLALEFHILRFETGNIALRCCHITLQRCDILTVLRDFHFQLGIFIRALGGFCSNSVCVFLRLVIKRFQVFRNIIRTALLDIFAVCIYRTDTLKKIGIRCFSSCLFVIDRSSILGNFFFEFSIFLFSYCFFCLNLILQLRLCSCNRCITIRCFQPDGSITIISFLRNSGSNCILSLIFFIRDLAINIGRRRIVCEFRFYVSTCLCEFLIHISFISFGFQRSQIRFASHSICKIIQRLFCSIRGISNFRINFLCNSFFIISYIGSVFRDFLPLSRCRILQIFDIFLVSINVCLCTIVSQQSINLTCRINFF